MAHYQFESRWALRAPIERVFDVALKAEHFGEWWPSVTASSLISTGEDGMVGHRARYRVKSPLLYSMSFETTVLEAERPFRIHAKVRGDLVGTGTYLLASDGPVTQVRFLWFVSTTKRWMNLLAPLARPLFAWAHKSVMSKGARAMAKHLGTRLDSVSTHSHGQTDRTQVGGQSFDSIS